MQQTPPFLEHLGLTHEADDRDVKRAYARQLKQIDQATDAAAFQRLREAYEASMNWLAWRRHQMAQEAAEQAASPSTVDGDKVLEGQATGRVGDTGDTKPAVADAQAPEPSSEPVADMPEAKAATQASAPPAPQALAAMLFDEHFATPCTDEVDARARLDGCLDDPRLVDLEARLFFEWRVAHALAEGYRAGHDALWAAAQAVFHWDSDHTRLRQFNRVGHVLENAINEQDFFARQEESRRFEQARIMQRLRGEERPHDSEFARLMPVLEWMLATYPNWMWVSTKAESVRDWRERHQALPQSLRAMRAPEPTSDFTQRRPPAAKPSSSHGRYFFYLACFVGVINFLRFVAGGHVDEHPYRGGTIQSAQVQEEMDRITRSMQSQAVNPKPGMDPAPLLGDGHDLYGVPQAATSATLVPTPIQKLEAAKLALGPRSKQRCAEAANIAHRHGMGTATPEPEFGPDFDTFISDCVVRKLWPSSGDPAAMLALKRDMARNEREIKRLASQPLDIRPATRTERAVPPNPALRNVGDPGTLELPKIAPTGVPALDSQRDESRVRLDASIQRGEVKLGGSAP